MPIEICYEQVIQTGALIVATVTFLVALNTYSKNSKIKAGEVLIKLEDNFKEHIDILLKIEGDETYRNEIVPAITAEHQKRDEKKDAIIKQLALMFRHFHTCLHIGELDIDDGMIDSVYRYYQRLLTRDDRKEIAAYMATYWKKVNTWAINAGKD